ncbi:MAG: hypothetical protein LBR00_07340, partial [Clostridiales Family XIII bacterium]|nr:hypothetical protein [Clostridiales Family XIII bacterium]
MGWTASNEIIGAERRADLANRILCVALAALILFSVAVRVRWLALGISLWNDEAMLAGAILDQHYGDEDFTPTSPAGHFYAVKALAALFGASETVLRAYSFAALLGALAVSGLLLRKTFSLPLPLALAGVFVISTFDLHMRYSGELKPYMGDVCCVLIILFAYDRFHKRKLGVLPFAAVCAAALVFSYPATFFAGAAFLAELALSLRVKDRRRALNVLAAGVCVAAVFALHYFLWIRPISAFGGLIWFWHDQRIRIPTDGTILNDDLEIAKNMLAPLGVTRVVCAAFALFGFVFSLLRRRAVSIVAGFATLLLFVAAQLQKYPLVDRLWLFLYALALLYAFVFLYDVRIHITSAAKPAASAIASKWISVAIPAFLAVCLFIPNAGFAAWAAGDERTLIPGEQANPLIEYVREHIRPGETLYSYANTNDVLRYKNGYDTARIGDSGGKDNILYGDMVDPSLDLPAIIEKRHVYVMMYHAYFALNGDIRIWPLQDGLREAGYLDRVIDVYETPLFWYSADMDGLKTRARLSAGAEGLAVKDGALTGTVVIENTGETILEFEGTGWWGDGAVYPVLRAEGAKGGTGKKAGDGSDGGTDALAKNGMRIGGLAEPLLPGESAEVEVYADGLAPG